MAQHDTTSALPRNADNGCSVEIVQKQEVSLPVGDNTRLSGARRHRHGRQSPTPGHRKPLLDAELCKPRDWREHMTGSREQVRIAWELHCLDHRIEEVENLMAAMRRQRRRLLAQWQKLTGEVVL